MGQRILYLDNLRRSGTTFAYPQALTLEEWRGLDALATARTEIQREQEEKERIKRERDEWLRRMRRY